MISRKKKPKTKAAEIKQLFVTKLLWQSLAKKNIETCATLINCKGAQLSKSRAAEGRRQRKQRTRLAILQQTTIFISLAWNKM